MSNINELTAVKAPVAHAGRTVHLAYLILCAFPLAVSSFMSTNGTLNSVNLFGFTAPVRLPCLIKYLTGFNCPTCGMTRSFIYMSHLNLGAAFAINRAGPILYALCVFEVLYRSILLVRGHVPLQKVLTIFERSFFAVFVAVDVSFFLWQFIRLL